MKYFALLVNLKLFNLKKLWRLLTALKTYGTNLMALLAFAKANTPDSIALEDENGSITYSSLQEETLSLIHYLKGHHQLTDKSHVLLIGRNSRSFIKAIFSVSGIGADLYLVNPVLKKETYTKFLSQKNYDLIICDEDTDLDVESCNVPVLYTNHVSLPSVAESRYYKALNQNYIKSKRKGAITVLTSGSTGFFKEAKRKPSTSAFIDPLLDITEKLKIQQYSSLFVAVPLFHGFGLASLFMAVFFSKKVFMHKKFNATKLIDCVAKNNIEVIAVVPLMLQKILDETIPSSHPIKCVISGGDKLNPALVKHTQETLGQVLHNLYGTSEAGVCTIATPSDLLRFPATIGKKIRGSEILLLNETDKEVTAGGIGELSVFADWSMESKGKKYIRTGDLAVKNEEGYFFLRGRKDDMIVIGGENIFPVELESVVYLHPSVKWTKAESFEDSNHMTQLKLKVVFEKTYKHSAEELNEWLSPQLAKHLKPALIEVLEGIPDSKLM